MKRKVFILTGESRLADAIAANFDPEFESVVATDWETGKDQLFGGNYDTLFLDLESLRGHPIDTFISIDAMCLREEIAAALVVRVNSEAIENLRAQLRGFETVIETKRGRTEFNRAIRRLLSDSQKESLSESYSDAVSIDQVAQLEFDLPFPYKGNINDHSVFDLMFAAHVRNASGYLTVSQGPESRKFALRSGDLALADGADGVVDLRETFKWENGTFEFQAEAQVAGRKKRLNTILADGAKHDISRRRAMDSIMSSMSHYPVPTTLADQAEFAYKAFPEALATLKRIDGKTPWSELLGDDDIGFQIAFFLQSTYLVHTMAERGLKKVTVVWSRDVRQARDRQQQSQILESKAYRAVSKQAEMERELRNQLRDFRAATPHEIYGLWEGCGASAVQNRFYEMVKEYHPDVYGGNTTGQVRTLAQDIFILVKDTFNVLRELEPGEQTTEIPDGFKRPETAKVQALTEDSEIDSEPDTDFEIEVEFDRERSRTITRPKTKTDVDVKAKMSQLSSVRKRRARRKSVAGKKKTPQRAVTPDPRTLELLSDVQTEPSSAEDTAEEKEAKKRMLKLKALRDRAREKNPNAVSPAQEHFRDGFKAFREEDFDVAFDEFKQAYAIEPERANHKAFYAYMWFKQQPENADDAEDLLRSAIEMNDRQTQPDAMLFMGHMLKARGHEDKALKFYERVLTLNPSSREAQRELRLAKLRKGSKNSEPGTFIKNLFKK